jgi:hypothetical protein
VASAAEREVPIWPTQLWGAQQHCVAVRGVMQHVRLRWGQRHSVSHCEACCDVAHAGGRGAAMCVGAREAAPWPCSWAHSCKGGGDMAVQLEGGSNVAMKVQGGAVTWPCGRGTCGWGMWPGVS